MDAARVAEEIGCQGDLRSREAATALTANLLRKPCNEAAKRRTAALRPSLAGYELSKSSALQSALPPPLWGGQAKLGSAFAEP